jgi:hypothetical protein
VATAALPDTIYQETGRARNAPHTPARASDGVRLGA